MRPAVLWIAVLIGVSGSLWCAVPAASPGTAEQAEWSRLLGDALAARELGDRERAYELLLEMEAARPDDPLAPYLLARHAEEEGAIRQALYRYQRPLGSPPAERPADWMQLTAGRWVRARQKLSELRVREALAAADSQELHAGLCVVLPLEPMILGEDSALADLEALGMAAASWITAALTQMADAQTVDLHTVQLLSRVLSARELPRTTLAPLRKPEFGEAVAPTTTTLGAAQRLAALQPSGAPPWDAEGAVPGRYLTVQPIGEWTPELARAVAHFQADHGLVPSGALDPEVRRALELAFRQSLQPVVAAPPQTVGADPVRAIGNLLGAEALLTGTLEREAGGVIRWDVAWLSPGDGSLISKPLTGILPETRFREAWTRMLRRILEAAPPCIRAGGCADLVLPPIPEWIGARDYGRALLLLEDDRPYEASRQFKLAAVEGAGDRAAWYAMAWGASEETLARLEQAAIEYAFHGPLELDEMLLDGAGWTLASGLLRKLPDEVAVRGSHRADSGLQYFPRTAWIHVYGQVEGR